VKKSSIALTAFPIVLSFYAVYLHLNPKSENSAASFHAEQSIEIDKTATPAQMSKTPALSSQIQKSSASIKANREALLAWNRSRGYLLSSENGEPTVSDYDGYDNETLRELANQYDPRAMLMLGDRLQAEGDLNEPTALYVEASVHGYTNSMIRLANISLQRYHAAENKSDKKHNAMEAYSWFETAIMRGDHHATRPKEMYSIEFNDEEQALIATMAEQHYKNLLARREQLGLGKFDNSTFESIDQ